MTERTNSVCSLSEFAEVGRPSQRYLYFPLFRILRLESAFLANHQSFCKMDYFGKELYCLRHLTGMAPIFQHCYVRHSLSWSRKNNFVSSWKCLSQYLLIEFDQMNFLEALASSPGLFHFTINSLCTVCYKTQSYEHFLKIAVFMQTCRHT